MNIILNDSDLHKAFAPLSLTRPVGDLRIGVFTNKERWTYYLPEAIISFKTENYLAKQFDCRDATKESIIVNAGIIPNHEFVATIINLNDDEALYFNELKVAYKGNGTVKVNYCGEEPISISKRWHVFQKNKEVLEQDFILLSNNRVSKKLSSSNTLIGSDNNLFIEEGAVIEASILNTNEGPIYIGKNSTIMEGSIIRGALALCDNATIKMGAKIYGPSTIGPYCKAGGEINNVVFQAYSNKGHDGFLGNSIIGEWCNLGADTNTSNLKNNYGSVDTFCYEENKMVNTESSFVGLSMGDHSKCGINTMFNTGTVVGVSCNIFGANFPPKHIPSFSWCDSINSVPYKINKAIEYANNMMSRRGKELSTEEINILNHIQQNH